MSETKMNKEMSEEVKEMMDKREFKCVVCENPVDNNGECESNSGYICMGYGSTLDTSKLDMSICDACANRKIEKGIIIESSYLNEKNQSKIAEKIDISNKVCRIAEQLYKDGIIKFDTERTTRIDEHSPEIAEQLYKDSIIIFDTERTTRIDEHAPQYLQIHHVSHNEIKYAVEIIWNTKDGDGLKGFGKVTPL